MAKTLERIEECGTARWVGYSFAWVAALYACFADGDNALKYLDIFKNAFISSNGFHLNGDYKKLGYCDDSYRPFTLEGNGIFADALQEMLMQYHHGILRLFPAIPKTWKEQGCSFKGFYLNKDVKVNASLKNGKIECNIENNGEARALQVVVFDRLRTVYLQSGKNSITF